MPTRCTEKDCMKSAIYNYENETKRIYCKNHKKENMIMVNTKKMYL